MVPVTLPVIETARSTKSVTPLNFLSLTAGCEAAGSVSERYQFSGSPSTAPGNILTVTLRSPKPSEILARGKACLLAPPGKMAVGSAADGDARTVVCGPITAKPSLSDSSCRFRRISSSAGRFERKVAESVGLFRSLMVTEGCSNQMKRGSSMVTLAMWFRMRHPSGNGSSRSSESVRKMTSSFSSTASGAVINFSSLCKLPVLPKVIFDGRLAPLTKASLPSLPSARV